MELSYSCRRQSSTKIVLDDSTDDRQNKGIALHYSCLREENNSGCMIYRRINNSEHVLI